MVNYVQKTEKEILKMDSVFSWFVAVVLAIIGSAWFIAKAEDELNRHKKENEDFFAAKEIYDNYKKNHKL